MLRRRDTVDDKDFYKYTILTRQQHTEKKNIEELEKEESNYKNQIIEGEIEEGEGEPEEEENLKDKISNYFTAKSK